MYNAYVGSSTAIGVLSSCHCGIGFEIIIPAVCHGVKVQQTLSLTVATPVCAPFGNMGGISSVRLLQPRLTCQCVP